MWKRKSVWLHLLISLVIILVVVTEALVPSSRTAVSPSGQRCSFLLGSSCDHSNVSWNSDAFPSQQQQQPLHPPAADADSQEKEENEKQFLAANRFSKFAPSTDLDADEFRAQLRDNMKRDLEERRRRDPTRGNQPAQNYLDSL